ncbi:hypothetical protein GEMRC1_000998 [Eukaryota sp. GEM-RC1]
MLIYVLLIVLLLLSLTCAVVESSHFDFLPTLVTSFNSSDGDRSFDWDARCFHENTMTFKFQDKDKKLVVSLETSYARSPVCMDTYLVLTQSGLHLREVFFRGRHRWHIRLSDQDFIDAKKNGVFIFNVDQSFIHNAKDVFHTLHMFMGKHSARENVDFLQERLNITLQPRHIPPTAFDVNLLRPGDVILESDGGSAITTIISFGTGAFAGHCGIILDIDGVLHFVESTYQAHGKEFKPRRGFSATPFERWLKEESTIKYEMAILMPLSDDISKRFNNSAAVEWFKRNEGTPYGMSNFIYTFIDTEHDNWPGSFTWQMILVATKIAEAVVPDYIDTIMFAGLRHRLNDYSVKSVEDIVKVLIKRGDMNFGQLLAIPEDKDWMYDGNRQLVCSSFVFELLKQGGIFHPDLIDFIVPQEQTPKDLAQLAIYRENWPDKPAYCGYGTSSICQVFGNFHYPEIEYFNKIDPYVNMNLFCPLQRTPDMKC